VDYLFQNAQATDELAKRNLYYVSSPTGDLTIRVTGGNYLYLDSNDQLTTTPNEEEATVFGRLPIIGTNKFNLYFTSAPGDDYFLVTSNVRSPFNFYLSRRYPDEPRAVFHLREVTVEESYANERDNINQTVSLIHTSPNLDKAAAYGELLTLMQSIGHMEGSEIFTVASYIVADTGLNSGAFDSLPVPVQVVFESRGLKLSYKEFPMKYSWASDLHTDIKPYTLTRDERTGLWAITYASAIQLSVVYNGPLVDIPTAEKHFDFQLYYYPESTEPASIELKCYTSLDTSFYSLVTDDDQPDFYFRCDQNEFASKARFTFAAA